MDKRNLRNAAFFLLSWRALLRWVNCAGGKPSDSLKRGVGHFACESFGFLSFPLSASDCRDAVLPTGAFGKVQENTGKS